jgi:hypothetical protein
MIETSKNVRSIQITRDFPRKKKNDLPTCVPCPVESSRVLCLSVISKCLLWGGLCLEGLSSNEKMDKKAEWKLK